VCGVFALDLDGEVVKAARLAYGGMAAIPKRAAKAEAALIGQKWTLDAAHAAAAAIAQDFAPLSDMRASAEYRAKVAANLIVRFWHETSGSAATRVVRYG
jgi:xanthine dehydrogenase small subunit